MPLFLQSVELGLPLRPFPACVSYSLQRVWVFIQSVRYNTPKTLSHSAGPVLLAWGTANGVLEWWSQEGCAVCTELKNGV